MSRDAKTPYKELTGGSIISYHYQWRWQHERGEDHGRKKRESVVAIRTVVGGRDTIFVFPITSQPPSADRHAFELPELEVRRIGRGRIDRLWIVIDEMNTDEVARSYVLEPGCKLGDLSRSVYEALLKRIKGMEGSIKIVNRAE
ncbi:MAG: hypothetical protein CMI63_20720 [Parvularcula sp.]|nr:hypothetical protein [Parvularcula sp.]